MVSGTEATLEVATPPTADGDDDSEGGTMRIGWVEKEGTAEEAAREGEGAGAGAGAGAAALRSKTAGPGDLNWLKSSPQYRLNRLKLSFML